MSLVWVLNKVTVYTSHVDVRGVGTHEFFALSETCPTNARMFRVSVQFLAGSCLLHTSQMRHNILPEVALLYKPRDRRIVENHMTGVVEPGTG